MKSKILALACVALMGALLLRVPVVGAATTFNETVGGGANSIAANGFFPKSITIHAGDTVKFTNPYNEPHTTTFLTSGMAEPPLIIPGPSGPPQMTFNPLASNPTFTGTTATFDATKYFNSGILSKDSTFSVTFPSNGTFKFICLFHGGMELSVSVVAAGATADSQAALDSRAASELQANLAAGEAAASAVVPAGTESLPDGTSKYHAVAGTESTTPGIDADVMRFFRNSITVRAGDTVEWLNTTDIPHTVSFGFGTNIPPLATPLPQPSGPPLLALNPAVFAPAGGTTYSGTGQLNSGVIGEGFGATTTDIKFMTPGTFTYVCLIHADQNMMGTITVTGAAAGAAATPTAGTPSGISGPNTGTGPEASGGWAGWLTALALAAVAGASLVFGGMRMQTRSRG